MEQNRIWKDSPIYGYRYEISNDGLVRNKKTNRILKQCINPAGYFIVWLYEDGIRKGSSVHLLVWDTFGNAPRNGRILQVDHIDNNPVNNCIDNLQLLNNRDNVVKSFQGKRNLPIGVFWSKIAKKYSAQIRFKNKKYHLGFFRCPTKAHFAYLLKLKELQNGKITC